MEASLPETGFAARLLKVLRAVAAGHLSGTLTVAGGRSTKKLFFHDGNVLAVASADPDERLGHYLVGWGLLTADQLEELLEVQRDKPRGLGELVVARRLIDREAMALLLRIRAEDALFDLVRWNDGECRFARDVIPVRGYLELNLPIEPLLADLERLLTAWQRWGRRVPGPHDIPHVVSMSEFRTLSMREADILRLVDGRRSLGEVAIRCRVSQLEVLVILQHHARGGLVRFASAALAPTRDAPGWAELLREAENSLAFSDLLEAYQLLCRALSTADTSRQLQEQAMALEDTIRQRIDLDEQAVLQRADPATSWPVLGEQEKLLIAELDGRTPLAAVLERLGGDKLGTLLIAHSLLQHGLVRNLSPS